MNLQPSIFNTKRPMFQRISIRIGGWMSSIAYWMLLLCFSFSVSAKSANNTLPPLAPPYGQLPPTFWQQHGTSIIVGSIIFLTLAALVVWMILKPRPQPVRPPAVVAREALARLQQQPEDGRTLSAVSQILRHYVLAALALPPGELTTGEFSATLAGNEIIGAELSHTISGFLRECDERKFSSTNSAPQLDAINRAFELVEQTERRRLSAQQVPSPKEVKPGEPPVIPSLQTPPK